MRKLIIDTSSEYGILAILEGAEIVATTLFLHENSLSRSLLPEISSLMNKARISLAQIDDIAVGVGPGSYTGTRVGVIVAKSLAYALNRPLRGFCSPLIFLPSQNGNFAGIIPAKSGLFFLVKGEKSKDLIALNLAHLTSAEALCEEIQDVDFIAAKNKEELTPLMNIDSLAALLTKTFFTFHPNIQNASPALRLSPVFPFEVDAQLIYLHSPH